MENLTYYLCLASIITLAFLVRVDLSQAQISSDGTLSTKVQTRDNLNFIVTGGSKVGGNLFHSFEKLSVPEEGSVIFENLQSVQNIISRVTGNSISLINGMIQANGSANIFLLNPDGIEFGSHALLQIGGSFIASTAEQIHFSDGSFLSATKEQQQPLLTISTPVGLQFGATPGTIINRSVTEGNSIVPVGLEVQPGRTLALIGGDIILEGGTLSASAGRVELGSVAGDSLVMLTPTITGWVLGYQDVENFRDIQLLAGGRITTTGANSGSIQLQGKQISITNSSEVTALNFGTDSGKAIVLNAAESVYLAASSSINTVSLFTGAAGDIIIETRQLLVRDDSFIDAGTFGGQGEGGDIIVNASEMIELSELSQLTARTFSQGDAGNVQVMTQKLILTDGSQIGNTTFSLGNAGIVTIRAVESVEVRGRKLFVDNQLASSGIRSLTRGDEATGNGGIINIETDRLVVEDGAEISTAAIEDSKGQAGNLEINARSIRLEDKGKLTATTQGGEGNITLQVENLLLLQGNSEIVTNASGIASGGNIGIDTDILVALEDSDITANAQQGQGGKVIINTQGIFLSPDSDITATSELGPQFNGIVEINIPDVDPAPGLKPLPENLEVPKLFQGCQAVEREGSSSFVLVGREGLPPSPNEISSNIFWEDLRAPISSLNQSSTVEENISLSSSSSKQIVQAQGWIVDADGTVILTAQVPVSNVEQSWRSPNTCNLPISINE